MQEGRIKHRLRPDFRKSMPKQNFDAQMNK